MVPLARHDKILWTRYEKVIWKEALQFPYLPLPAENYSFFLKHGIYAQNHKDLEVIK